MRIAFVAPVVTPFYRERVLCLGGSNEQRLVSPKNISYLPLLFPIQI